MSRDRLASIVLPVAAAIAVLPLVLHGPSCGHDFDFHLLNWFEAAAQFRHGHLHPHWAVSPAWNAGEPRFVFYPPLSWTLGAVLGLLMPWTWTPIVYTWLALTASGFTMRRLACAHASPNAALLAATLYLANPYMLFTAYERTAYAELLAAVFLPLLVDGILKPRPTILGIAIPVALLWLTNAPAAVMGSYTLALLALIRLAYMHRQVEPAFRLAATAFGGTVLGLALAAFYIVPAATERPYVQIAMAVLPGLRVDDNTLFHHTGVSDDALAHDAVLHTASLLAVILGTMVAAALLLIRLRRLKASSTRFRACLPESSAPDPCSSTLTSPLTLLSASIFLLLTPISLPLWHHAPELAFLQFPWRLLAVLAVALALSIALVLNQAYLTPRRTGVAAVILAVALASAAYPAFNQPCESADTIQARLKVFAARMGAEPTDEYTPVAADNDSLGHHNPPFWLSPNADADPPANAIPAPLPQDLDVSSPVAEHLILNLRLYPAWRITLNGRPVSAAVLNEAPRADGLITLPLPSGPSHLHVEYTMGPLAYAADALSVSALLAMLLALGTRARAGKT